MFKYTQIQAQYDNYLHEIIFYKFSCMVFPDNLATRFVDFGDVIIPEVKKINSIGEPFYIVQENEVEIKKIDKERLSNAIYDHLRKIIKNRESQLKNEKLNLKVLKIGINNTFAKIILNKKLKKIK